MFNILSLVLLMVSAAAPGPVIGDLTSTSVRLWVHTDGPKEVPVVVRDGEGTPVQELKATTTAANGNCSTITIQGLEPGTRYTYSVGGQSQEAWWFRTLADPAPSCRMAFGSCANEKEGSSKVWRRLDAENLTALVLLGDTPYIDTTNLDRQRERYREFSAVPAFGTLVAHVPLYSTWDDHDFGRNDTDGNLPGKENSRRAFREHRPNPSFGEDGKGIYTSFRQGPVEVFLLDPRWFARTEGEEEDPSLLGAQQWKWLERSLGQSTAPYKVIAGGMVFNAAVRKGKSDCWGVYPKEYARLLEVIKKTGSTGVVFVSGDVHWSRAIQHDTADVVGYDVFEFVTSPIHEHLIKAADAPHPGLAFSIGEVNSFLLLDAAPGPEGPVLSMSLCNAAGERLYSKQWDSPPGQ
ncbi:MAG: alkaline phosphatase D family protein [Phycisphaerales bacterium]|nr:alkaline phosphatase D family protein [Phycisphaerales bacterium]